MKKIIYLAMTILAFTTCKSRKVVIHKTDSNSVSSTVSSVHESAIYVDTSKTSATKKITEQKKVVLKDSSGTITTITPVAGTTSIVKPDGTFTGQASSIRTERHGVKNKTSTSDKTSDEINAQAKGISDNHVLDKDFNKKDSIHVVTKNKDTIVTPDHSWILWLGAGCLMIIILAWLYFKFKL